MKNMFATKMGALAVGAATLAGVGGGAIASASSASASGSPVFVHLSHTYKGKGDCIVARDRETKTIMKQRRIWRYGGTCRYTVDDDTHKGWYYPPVYYYSNNPVIKGDYRASWVK